MKGVRDQLSSGDSIERVYVTCMGDCSIRDHELYDGFSVREGRRIAREHARATGHSVCVDETRSHFFSATRSP